MVHAYQELVEREVGRHQAGLLRLLLLTRPRRGCPSTTSHQRRAPWQWRGPSCRHTSQRGLLLPEPTLLRHDHAPDLATSGRTKPRQASAWPMSRQPSPPPHQPQLLLLLTSVTLGTFLDSSPSSHLSCRCSLGRSGKKSLSMISPRASTKVSSSSAPGSLVLGRGGGGGMAEARLLAHATSVCSTFNPRVSSEDGVKGAVHVSAWCRGLELGAPARHTFSPFLTA